MTRLILAVLLGGLLMSCIATRAEPETETPLEPGVMSLLCGDRDRMIGILENMYGQSKRGHGTTSQGGLVELWYAPNGGSWTVIFITPEGDTCLYGYGDSWEVVTPRKGAI